MVLEATIICIDDSEFMRNGDYHPSRIEAQADAVFAIAGAKTRSNPENKVGILTMAGKRPRLLANTTDVGQVLASIHDVEIGGEADMKTAIAIAQLNLKNRQNKSQQQRIIVFAGSPVKHDKETLELIGKNLKKNNVALDIVNFGEQDGGKTEKLEALLAAVNNYDNSHIVHIPPGPNSLSDVLLSTPIMYGGAGAARGGGDFEFGVDPNIDPELAFALRVSMEEERARQEAAAKRAAEESSDVSMISGHDTKAVEEALASMDALDISPLLKEDYLELATPGDRYLKLSEVFEWHKLDGAAKDESSQSDMSKDVEDQYSMPFDVRGDDPNDPSESDLPASVQTESEDALNTPLLKGCLELASRGDRCLKLTEVFEWFKLDGGAKDENIQSDLEDQSSMSSDVRGADPNDPSESDLPASVQNESELEEKKKEEKSPSDEN